MAETVFTLRTFDAEAAADAAALAQQLREYATVTTPSAAPAPQRYTGAEIMIALGSAGAFTAAYQIIKAFLDRHQNTEVSVQQGDRHASFKGYSAPDARTLLRETFPDRHKDA